MLTGDGSACPCEGEGTVIVEDPTTMTPLEPSETRVPAMVTGAALGLMVVPSTATLPLGRRVAALLPSAAGAAGSSIVEEPTTSLFVSMNTGVPEIVIAGSFGASVVPAMATPAFEGRMEAGWPAADMIWGAGACAGAEGGV